MHTQNLPLATSLEDFLPIDTLAKAFGVSKQTAYRWRDLGMPVIRLGSRTYVRRAAVAAWLTGLETVVEPGGDSESRSGERETGRRNGV